jgi:putative colanic acid biosynthesis acetyltransferase WcaF
MTSETGIETKLAFYDPPEYAPGWPLSMKAYLAAWRLTSALVFRFLPTRCFKLRNFFLRLFGARIHPSARVYPSCRIYLPFNLTMGPRSCLGPDVDCLCAASVQLDADVTVSQNAFLCTAAHDVDACSRPLTTAPIHLARGSWVFARAIVLPGVTLGEGAVAAAGCVVTRSVDAFAIVAGNPARVIRQRDRRAFRNG